ncbi:MAG: hypothetical protein ABI648_05150 [Betaproteobacteria bacterium]
MPWSALVSVLALVTAVGAEFEDVPALDESGADESDFAAVCGAVAVCVAGSAACSPAPDELRCVVAHAPSRVQIRINEKCR